MANKTRSFHFLIYMILMIIIMPISAADAKPQGSNPKYAMIIMDAQTGKVLEEENADKSLSPASLTKLMTLFLTFEAIEHGHIHMNKYLTISRHAMNQAPSKIGLQLNEKITVKQAIPILVTRSANDVAVALAETIGGSEKRFVEMMTQRAHSLGMKNSYFYNANGLPNPAQKSSARDMAILGRAMMQYFPQHYHFFKTIRTSYRGKTIETHNNLMRRFAGMDGLKTGFTNASGFNLVASAVRNNRRVIVSVFGGRTAASRDEHVADLLNRGLAQLEREKRPTQMANMQFSPPKAAPKPVEIAQGDTDNNAIQPVPVPANTSWRPPAPVAALNSPNQPPTAVYNKASTSVSPNQNWGIQVGAFSDSAISQKTLVDIQARLRPHLQVQGQPVIIPTTTPRGIVYRARIIGLSAKDASKACELINDCMAFTVR